MTQAKSEDCHVESGFCTK